MARRRRKVAVGYGKARVSYEWIGFSDALVSTNLTTSVTRFELVPPAGASGVIEPDITVQRVVGMLTVRQQDGVTSGTGVAMAVHVVDVGSDQTIDDDYDPLHSDADALDYPVMWWWPVTRVGGPVVKAEQDTTSLLVPVDIKVKRKMGKRQSLILTARAGSSNVLALGVNLRSLIRIY